MKVDVPHYLSLLVIAAAGLAVSCQDNAAASISLRDGMPGLNGANMVHNGEMPNGEMPNGEMPNGEMPNGEMPNGGGENGHATGTSTLSIDTIELPAGAR